MGAAKRPAAAEIIRMLGLEPLDGEGGMYRQTYAHERTIEGAPLGTAIYYLLAGRSFSHLHRLAGDEVYHFYLGDPVELLLLYPGGESRVITLGPDLARGQTPQFAVPAGVWQGSALSAGGEYALLGTTMAPGYTGEGYEHGDRQQLCEKYPSRQRRILELTGDAVAF